MSEKEEEKQKIGDPLPVTREDVTIGPKVGEPVDLAEEDVTPITREKINKVKSTDWENLNITQLYNQLDTLNKRLDFARTQGHQEMIDQLSRGILRLQLLIQQKSSDEIKLI